MPKEGDLQVWWIPQVPMKAYIVNVDTPREGKKMLDALAQYDLFQLENNIKPDYCNAGGLNVFEDGEWVNWYSEEGEDIDEIYDFAEPPVDQDKYLDCPKCGKPEGVVVDCHRCGNRFTDIVTEKIYLLRNKYKNIRARLEKATKIAS